MVEPQPDVSTGELLARCSFPAVGSAVDCAVSGGPDSLALLVLATAAGCEVTAHHVDHGLRVGSTGEADVVAEAAARLGARFVASSADLAPGPNLEARARTARYEALPPGVLTGHTADDQAETVLLNMLRGAGLDGLAGMSPGTRPLRSLRRWETVALCAVSGLEPVIDPSNHDPAFRRNRVRHEVLPLLSDVAQRDVPALLARQADLVREDVTYLEELASTLDVTDARALAAAPLPLARRALRAWLRGAGPGGAERHPPSVAEVERVLDVARGLAVACQLRGGWRVARRMNRLSLVPPDSGQPLR